MTTATQSALTLATYGSPLRKRGVGPALTVTLSVFILFFLSQLTTVFRDPQPATLSVFLVALSVTGALSLIPVLVYRWLDRREPEPWFMYGLAFLWGGLIASGMALEINTALDQIVGGFLGGALGAPVVEESAKGLGLIVLLVVLRGEFDGPRDGFLYGALIGLGFNWMESSVYITNGFIESGTVPWGFQLAARFVLPGFSGHSLYTAITGTFIGLSLLQRGVARRILLPLVGLVLAMLNHMLWNTLGALVAAALLSLLGAAALGAEGFAALNNNSASLPFWLAWPANLVAVLAANWLGLLVVLLGLRRSDRWERDVMAEQLKPLAGSALVTPAEYANIAGRCEPPREPRGRRIFVAQCNLAKRMFYLLQHGRPADPDPVVGAWRAELSTLRRTSRVQ